LDLFGYLSKPSLDELEGGIVTAILADFRGWSRSSLRVLLLLLLRSDHVVSSDCESVDGVGEPLNVELVIQSALEVVLELIVSLAL
jgi:hypothetical protein